VTGLEMELFGMLILCLSQYTKTGFGATDILPSTRQPLPS